MQEELSIAGGITLFFRIEFLVPIKLTNKTGNQIDSDNDVNGD